MKYHKRHKGETNMLQWKIEPLVELKTNGYNQRTLIDQRICGSETINALRRLQTNISLDTLGKICKLTGKQPGDLLEWVDETDEL